uniref:Cytochrome c oxidase subunit 2 n=1 Tax=Raeta sp. TaxID=3067663 RepID=A0AA49X718_9BIVA|nr:cytochrome c oxidase subunit 2 [Raeta sp.]
MSYWGQVGLLDPKTDVAESLVMYNDGVLVVIASVLILVGWFLLVILSHNMFFKGMWDQSIEGHQALEVCWTVAPSVVLVFLGLDSLKNLYNMEVGSSVAFSVEAVGHQWYWEYVYIIESKSWYKEVFDHYCFWCSFLLNENTFSSGWKSNYSLIYTGLWGLSSSELAWSLLELYCPSVCAIRHESYMVPDSMLDNKSFGVSSRLVSVTKPCFLFLGEKNEIKVSTADVMHSWGVPEFGVKIDAVPGRLNCVKVIPRTPGFSVGVCYELCGAGHSAMPIVCFVSNRDTVLGYFKKNVVEMMGVEKFRECFSPINT